MGLPILIASQYPSLLMRMLSVIAPSVGALIGYTWQRMGECGVKLLMSNGKIRPEFDL
jgi:hypothetical protein